MDIKLGSRAEGGGERDRADTSLNTRVEVVESSTTTGLNSSGGKPILHVLVSSVQGNGLLLLNFCCSGELVVAILRGWLKVGEIVQREVAEALAKSSLGRWNFAGNGE